MLHYREKSEELGIRSEEFLVRKFESMKVRK